MKCNFYFELTPVNFEVLPQIMLLIHHFNHQNRNNKIAIAFPHMREGARRTIGSTLRFWNDDEILLKQLQVGVMGMKVGHCSEVLARPSIIEEYIAYRHFKVPSRNTKGTDEQNQKSAVKRMEKIEKCGQLPYINISSRSTGQQFPLNIEKNVSFGTQNNGDVDSYGLSSSHALYLPSWTPKNILTM